MDDVKEKKRELVNEIVEKIESFPEEDRKKMQAAVEERLFDFANFIESKIALLYLRRHCEVDTENIIKESLKKGKKIVLPLIDRENNKTTLYKIENLKEDLRKGADDTLEPNPDHCKAVPPEQIDIAIVPGLAFDEKGGRIGIVDNFYDKFIARLPMTTRKVAIAFEAQVISQVPADSRSKYIDIIVTNKRTIYKI
ncbi:MAG: 5-formyltetrahydrofolate cyclo-ligase [Proteobacteria bacterium]|nr:5-formyltetrahydrofolate cyclo-ligase [Pseudomonadota bacterium]